MSFIHGRTVAFVVLLILNDRASWALVTFPGNAALSPANWFNTSVADALSSLNGYNTVPVICCNNTMHRNHASVVCRLNAKLFWDVKWHCCKHLNMNSIYESVDCSWRSSRWGMRQRSCRCFGNPSVHFFSSFDTLLSVCKHRSVTWSCSLVWILTSSAIPDVKRFLISPPVSGNITGSNFVHWRDPFIWF